MSIFGWSLPPGCGALPGEGTGSVALNGKTGAGWWTEDNDIGYTTQDDGDVVVAQLEWDDALSEDQNLSAATALLDQHPRKAIPLDAFKRGDGAHRGLSDWYPENEAALKAALAARKPFDTGWYGSKHEIASARIRSTDGQTIKVEASVSDDFDTEGLGSRTTTEWTLEAVAEAVDSAWDEADEDRKDNEPYTGFSIHDSTGAWIETYLLSVGDYDTPPGDNYHWWGWQHDEKDDVGIPHPDIPADAVAAFEAYATTGDWSTPLTVSGWTIRPWRD